jgi:hypothetical protein
MKFSSNNTNNNRSNSNNAQALVADNIQFLVEQLEAGNSEALTGYLNAMARFHNYSFGNILLIGRQKPDASRVAGMYAWNQLGRRVKRGEKGIQIYAPMLGRRRKEHDNTDAKTAETSKPAWDLVGFRPVFVWDVKQTEGKELPELDTVKGDVGTYLESLRAFVKEQGIKLDYFDKEDSAKGMSYGGTIRLRPDLPAAEEFSVLVHELAHEMLHKTSRRTMTTKTVRETEAEAIAFVVCQSIGLETGSASSDYIRLYHGNAKLLQESLEIVQRTAAVILGAISPEVRQAEKPEQPQESQPTEPAATSQDKALAELCITDEDIPF